MIFGSVGKYKDHEFKSINHANALEEIQEDKEEKTKIDIKPFINKVKKCKNTKNKYNFNS